MLNKTIIIGRLTRDLELRKTNEGKSVLNFSVAVNRQYNKEQTDFINCIAWEQTADFMSKYLNKGALISVEGRIQTGSYEGTDGKKVYTTDVIAERVQALESRSQREGQTNTNESNVYKKEEEPVLDITDMDLPFN